MRLGDIELVDFDDLTMLAFDYEVDVDALVERDTRFEGGKCDGDKKMLGTNFASRALLL